MDHPGERLLATFGAGRRSLSSLAGAIRDDVKGDDAEPCAVGSVTPNPGLFVGRVCLDALEGKLNKSSVVLEGERADGAYAVRRPRRVGRGDAATWSLRVPVAAAPRAATWIFRKDLSRRTPRLRRG